MAFTGFSRPFVSAYRGFGPNARLAAAGAAGLAVGLPALLADDDRGYGRTAAVTTPLVGAGFVAAPGVAQGAQSMWTDWRSFWQNRPFDFDGSTWTPRWKNAPELAELLSRQGPHVRASMSNILRRKQAAYFAGASSWKYDSARDIAEIESALGRYASEEQAYFAAAAKARDLKTQLAAGAIDEPMYISRLADAQREQHSIGIHVVGRKRQYISFGGRRLALSHAVAEAERAAMTPEQAERLVNTEGVRLRSLDEVRQVFEANKGNESFIRAFHRRALQADSAQLGRRFAMAPSPRKIESLNIADAIAELQMQKAGAAVRKAELLQAAVERGWIGSQSTLTFALTEDGKRSHLLGASVFHPGRDKSFQLPFVDDYRTGVSMGRNWGQRGVATGFYDMGKKYRPDELILSNLGSGWDKAQRAAAQAFSYSGVTDPTDPFDVAMHGDFTGAVLPEEAVRLRSLNYNPNPYGGFGEGGTRTWEQLNYEEKVKAAEEVLDKHGFTFMGPEGRLPQGRFQDAALEALAPGAAPSTAIQDPNLRAFAKPVGADAATTDGLRKTLVRSSAYSELAGITGAEHMRSFVAEEGQINPQLKVLFGDLPEEAEQAVRDWFGRGMEKAVYRHWKEDFIESLGPPSRRRWYEEEELRELFSSSDDFKRFDARRRAAANRWWGSQSGQSYARHAHEVLEREIADGTLSATEVTAKANEAFLRMQANLMEDPLRLVAARRLGRLGEKTAVASSTLKGVKLEMTRLDQITDVHADLNDLVGRELDAGTWLGFNRDAPVRVERNAVLEGFSTGEDGITTLRWRDSMPLAGAKADFGYGDKGAITMLEDFRAEGDGLRRAIEAYNAVALKTGNEALPLTAQMISQNTVSGMKTKVPLGDLLENAFQVANDMVSGPYTAAAKERAAAFLDDLVANHNYERRGLFIREKHKELLAMNREARDVRALAVGKKAEGFLNDIGLTGPDEYPLFAAFRETREGQRALGRTESTFSQYLFKGFRFSNVKPWSHDLLNVPSEVRVTYDMLGELARAGSPEGIRALYEGIDWTRGDPGRAAGMLDYVRGLDFSKPLGEAIDRNGVVRPRIGNDASRAGNSVFNPNWEKAQENFSVAIGATLKDVQVGDAAVDMAYLPKLGMRAYKGAPNAYDGGWSWTDLEKSYAEALEAVQDADWSKVDPAGKQAGIVRGKVSKYMNLLLTEMTGKDGVLRAEGIYRGGLSGYTAHVTSGPEGNPFEVFLSKEHLRKIKDPDLVERLTRGEGLYGPMFRHPVSAAHQVRYRYSELAHLDANQFGIHPLLSAPYQLDHDQDTIMAMFYKPGSEAEKSARAAIDNRQSAQHLNLEAANIFQGMEDAHQISGAMVAKDAAKKGWVQQLEDAVRLDREAGFAARRRKTLKARFTFDYVGHYSNASTRMQLMLANNPALKPGDHEFAFLNRLSQYIRQVTISAAKEKMDLGANPESLLSELNNAFARGEAGLDDVQRLFVNAADKTGFESVYTERMGEVTGITRKLKRDARGEILFENGMAQFGDEAIQAGEKINMASHWAASGRGREAFRKLLANPDNPRIARTADLLVKQKLTPAQAQSLLNSGFEDMSPEIMAMFRKGAGGESAFVKMARGVGGERAGSMAENVADSLGALNEALKDAWKTGKGSIGPAAKVLGIGLGVAAFAGLATTAVRSSNEHRPEERVGVADHVPGEPIAGARSSVNPKRRVLPARQDVRTAVVARVKQAVDLEVRAKAPDRSAQHEVAKLVERTAGGDGYTNVTVNRVGGWRDSVSKIRLRQQIRDELNRY